MIRQIMILVLFALSVSFVSAEINVTSCPVALSNTNNETINVMNDLNYTLNNVCFQLTNVSNIVVNGNGYSVNSTVTTTGTSTFTQISDNGVEGINNITFNNLKITGGNNRNFWIVSTGAINNIQLNNITINSTSIGTGIYALSFVNPGQINNLQLNSFKVYQLNNTASNFQGLISIANQNINITSITFDDVYIKSVNPLQQFGGSTVSHYYNNLLIRNSDITSTGTSAIISTDFNNVTIINTTLTFASPTTSNQIGAILLLNQLNTFKSMIIENSTFNNAYINYNNPSYAIQNMCLRGNNFNTPLFNSTNGVRVANIFLYINYSCSYDNIGFLPPSNITYTDFYYPVGNNISLIKYLSGYYPENAYKFMFYNVTSGYYYNETTITYSNDLTYFPNNNFINPFQEEGNTIIVINQITGDVVDSSRTMQSVLLIGLTIVAIVAVLFGGIYVVRLIMKKE